jgi:superfamily II DNA or RNA helicase
MKLWPHQERGLGELWASIDADRQAICVTSPTGGGKSRMMREIIRRATELRAMRVGVFVHRSMLCDQWAAQLRNDGIGFRLRASGKISDHVYDEPVQLSMVQTEFSRAFDPKKELKDRPQDLDLLLIDEAHAQKEGQFQTIFRHYIERGAVVVGFTATPMEIGHIYDQLIVAGTNSELRECGAHVLCKTYAPDECDLRSVKQQSNGEYSPNEMRKVYARPVVFGRILDHWRTLNPVGRPTILFGPDVAGSQWFAEQFNAAGIPAAHIDADAIHLPGGRVEKSTPELREQVVADVRSGQIKVVCNRFVLREGIDIPELGHCILATTFGSVASYLQAVGRLIRSHPSLDYVVLQDHGGNHWRHGSPNDNRVWDMNDTAAEMMARVIDKMRPREDGSQAVEDVAVCGKCGRVVRKAGDTCPECREVVKKSSRVVVQLDGTLQQQHGTIIPKPRYAKKDESTERAWEERFWGARRSKKPGAESVTFRQLVGRFCHFNDGLRPPTGLPFMPLNANDWGKPVQSVPIEKLIQPK